MPASAQKKATRPKPPIVPASEELRAFMAAIEHEVASWPEVRLNSMFGMTAIYRGKIIFGLLPKTRGFRSPTSLWVKFPNLTPSIKKKLVATPRILPPSKPTGAQWHTLPDISAKDYQFVIEWMAIAHGASK